MQKPYKAVKPIPLTLASHSVQEHQRAEAEPRTRTLVDEYPETEALPGWVNAYYVYENGRKCGPYFVRRWKVKGKLHKQYVAERHLRRTLAACARYRERKLRQRKISKRFTIVTGNLNFLWTMVKRSLKNTLRPGDHDFLAILEKEGIKAPNRPSLRSARRLVVPFSTKNKPASKRSNRPRKFTLRSAETGRLIRLPIELPRVQRQTCPTNPHINSLHAPA